MESTASARPDARMMPHLPRRVEPSRHDDGFGLSDGSREVFDRLVERLGAFPHDGRRPP